MRKKTQIIKHDVAPESPSPDTTGFKLNLEERVGHVLRRAYQRHVTIFQKYMNAYELTAAQYIALANLLENDICSLSDLVRHTAIDHTTIRGIIKRLKDRGLVFSEEDPSDARKVTVRLTAKGRDLTLQASAQIDSVSEETYNGMNEIERVALMTLLRRIANITPPSES